MSNNLAQQANPLLNGAFDHWPDVTTLSAAGKLAVMLSLISLGAAGAATVNRQAFVFGSQVAGGAKDGEPGGSLQFFARWNQTTLSTGAAGDLPELQHRIEHVRTLAGKPKVIYSGWYRSNQPVKVGLRQSFGTGGAPSADVDTALQILSPTLDDAGAPQWRRFRLEFALPGVTGKTLGTIANTSFVAVRVLGPINVLFQYDLANVMLTDADRIDDTPRRHFADEFELLKRYYWAGTLFAPVSTQSAMGYLFSRQMRIAPTIAGAGATHANITADAASIVSTGVAAAIPVTADARL